MLNLSGPRPAAAAGQRAAWLPAGWPRAQAEFWIGH
eukprot:COSAG05_NODE_12164_length_480_cov_1.175853_1_plen_35_part_01